MIDTKNRLCKLVRSSKTLEGFITEAVSKSHWYLSPYVSAGFRVDKPFIEQFWNTHKSNGGK